MEVTPTWRGSRHAPALAVAGLGAAMLAMLVASMSNTRPVLAVATIVALLMLLALPLLVGREGAVFGVLAIIAFLFTRPNILGETFGFAGILLWVALAWLTNGRRPPGLAAALLVLAGCVTAYWSFVGFMTVTRGGDTSVAVASLLACLGAAAGGWAFGSSRARSLAFRAALVTLCMIQIGGYAIALVLWRGGGSNAGHLVNFTLGPFGGRPSDYDLWVTGAITIDATHLLTQLGPRLNGWAGEPGILAATFAFVGVTYYGRGRAWVMALMGVGIVLTQSTAGIMVYAVALLVSLAFASRTVAGRVASSAGAVVAGAALLPMVAGSSLGIRAKLESNAESFNDRLDGVSNPNDVLVALTSHPFGVDSLDTRHAAITILQESLRFGPLVLLLAALAFLLPLAVIPAWTRALPGAVVLLFTVVFAQPGFTNPLWVLLIAWLLAQTCHDARYERALAEGLASEPAETTNEGAPRPSVVMSR